LSQKKAADDLGISQALLSHYENGVREPKLEFILKACDYYGVTTDYLLGRTDKKQIDWNAVLHSENAEIQRCVNAGSMILVMLSEIKDEPVSAAVSRYLSYSLYLVLNVLRLPTKPYEPLFDAAIKTAEAELIQNASRLKELRTNAGEWLSDEALKEKNPDLYKSVVELNGLIEKTVYGIRNINQDNPY
jgi:transcriptional regulator with XRE-family HTH domain